MKTNKEKMISLKLNGMSYGDISKEFNLSRSRVHQIISGYNSIDKRWLEIREVVKVRYNGTCQFCYKKVENNFVVHHLDHEDRNNSFDNLILLCRSCHGKIHSLARNNGDYKKYLCKICGVSFTLKEGNPTTLICRECVIKNKGKWSRYNDSCVSCGRTDIRHAGLGLCSSCMSKKRYNDPEKYKKHLKAVLKYYQKNREVILEKTKDYQKKYYKQNKSKKIEISRLWYLNKCNNDPQYREKLKKYYHDRYLLKKLNIANK